MAEATKSPQSDSSAPSGRLHPLVGRLVELGEFYMRDASDDDRYEWNVAKAEVRRLLVELAALSQRDEMLIWIAGEIQERVGWPSEWTETPNVSDQEREHKTL